MDTARSAQVSLEFDCEREPISGRISYDGRVVAFAGWLALAAVLETARAAEADRNPSALTVRARGRQPVPRAVATELGWEDS